METEEILDPLVLSQDEKDVISANPEIAKRATYWGTKYVEDRTRTIGERTKMIQLNLMGEFPALGRKGARIVATKITRNW